MTNESLEQKASPIVGIKLNDPALLAYGPEKERWKDAGNRYTPEELAKFEADMERDFRSGNLQFYQPSERVLNAD